MTDNVVILGSTGSIGVNTLQVVGLHPERYRVKALAAHTNNDLMLAQCKAHQPDYVVMVDPAAAAKLRMQLATAGLNIEVESGARQLDGLISAEIDTVVCGIVGAAGLPSTIAAVGAGKKVLIANKEPLVMLGEYIIALAHQHNATILPLDSEHNAMFQCLPLRWQQSLGNAGARQEFGVRRLWLTGSGGCFRRLPINQFASITPEQACAHPNWRMGRKISVDSATMMNKGLELIEACRLFAIDESRVDIVIHPQSVIHSMVEYMDGSVLAQMSNPDMKIPIANALGWPERIQSGAKPLDIFATARLDFEQPDHARFPALNLARNAVRSGGTAPVALNAANEVAVEAFLAGKIRFNQITELVVATMQQVEMTSKVDLNIALACDQNARALCLRLVNDRHSTATMCL